MCYIEDVAGVGCASYSSLARPNFSFYRTTVEIVGYLDVLPVPRLDPSRVQTRRNSLGGGTFRAGCGGYLPRTDFRLDLIYGTKLKAERDHAYCSNVFHGFRIVRTKGFGSRKLHLFVKQIWSASYVHSILASRGPAQSTNQE